MSSINNVPFPKGLVSGQVSLSYWKSCPLSRAPLSTFIACYLNNNTLETLFLNGHLCTSTCFLLHFFSYYNCLLSLHNKKCRRIPQMEFFRLKGENVGSQFQQCHTYLSFTLKLWHTCIFNKKQMLSWSLEITLITLSTEPVWLFHIPNRPNSSDLLPYVTGTV